MKFASWKEINDLSEPKKDVSSIDGSSHLTSVNRIEGNSDCQADPEFRQSEKFNFS